MNERMTEFEEKIIWRLLGGLSLPLILEVQAKLNNPCAFPPVKLIRTDMRVDSYIVYEMTCCGCKKSGCVPEAFVKVMDDIENGKILQSDADPNLRIEYIKSYEAYKS